MTTSSIEITDRAYLITLAKSEFDYQAVKQLLAHLFAGRLPGEWAHPPCDEPTDALPHEMAGRFDSLADK